MRYSLISKFSLIIFVVALFFSCENKEHIRTYRLAKTQDNIQRKNVNSENLEKDTWRGPFKIGWMYIVKLEVIEEFIKNRDSTQYIGLHEDKRFYDMIRNKYSFCEDKELENKYFFYGYPVINDRHRRNVKRKGNILYNNISKSTLVSNLNTQQLNNYRFK